jgi:hypothetical protein
MNENKTKELIHRSVVHTSDAFTKELMERIELKKSQARALRNAIIMVSVVCIVLLIIITRMPADFDLLHQQIKLPPLFIKVTGAIFVFTILNKLLSLRGEFKRAV